jgi:nickel/cobalt exporter
VLIAAVALIDGAIHAVIAAPFGMSRAPAPPEFGGITGWVLAKQAEFYRMLSGAIRAAKADGSAAATLMGISFAYGIFHAAGPGHGKAVISSYVVANNETWKRGVILSFASAVLQALVAILFVGIAAVLLGATAKMMGDAVRIIEAVSYGLIALIGARLLWVKGRALLRLLMPQTAELAHAHAHASHGHSHHGHAHHGHAHHDHAHNHDHAHDHHHDHDHDDASAWGHAHAPEPAELKGRDWWKRGLAAIVAVGLRPCSGAILVLVFALAQGIFWIGAAATVAMGIGTAITVAAIATVAVMARGAAGKFATAKPGVGMIALRGFETAAAGLVLVFGVLLLTGYLVSERMVGF